jgi:hypothetical protein
MSFRSVADGCGVLRRWSFSAWMSSGCMQTPPSRRVSAPDTRNAHAFTVTTEQPCDDKSRAFSFDRRYLERPCWRFLARLSNDGSLWHNEGVPCAAKLVGLSSFINRSSLARCHERFREDPPRPKRFNGGSASFTVMAVTKLAIVGWQSWNDFRYLNSPRTASPFDDCLRRLVGAVIPLDCSYIVQPRKAAFG